MSNIWYAIGDFFQYIFGFMPMIGNSINYFYIVVVTVFLVVWTNEMIKHRKNNQEHRSS